MKDGIIRRTVKRIALTRYFIDLKITRLILKHRGEPQYRLCGECTNCGACCETPMIATNRVFYFLKSARWMLLTWQRVVNGFEHIGNDRKNHTFIFRCTHFDPETKLCDAYESRPGMCRDYPHNLLYGPNPEFLEPCTLYAVHENADLMSAALDELDELPPEKVAVLKQKLHAFREDSDDE
jgi:Fe-S-cluster containining protein